MVTTAQQRWPDDLALDALQDAAAAFTALSNGSRPEHVEGALLHLCRAITSCEEAGISRPEIMIHLAGARSVHATSPFIARAQQWPRGYAGDFETIEQLCDRSNHAVEGTVGYTLEQLAMDSPITEQHRNKVRFQAARILAACSRTGGEPRVLSIGCGGCRDIRSVAAQLADCTPRFVLCDLDYDALDFALHALGPMAAGSTYLNATIPRVLRKLLRFGPFDLVIAGGVFDYLPDRWVTLSARTIWETLLAPGGELIFTNIKRGNPHRVWLEYLANWELTERDRAEIERCCEHSGIPLPDVAITEDQTGLALLVSCTKPD